MLKILANTTLAIILCSSTASSTANSSASDQAEAKQTGESVQQVLARRHGGHQRDSNQVTTTESVQEVLARRHGGHQQQGQQQGSHQQESQSHQAEVHAWAYSGSNGPDHWGSLNPDYALCGQGKNQSPINVTAAIEGALEPLSFNYYQQVATLENNGHTIQANIPSGNSVSLDLADFELKQFHFHSPAEHQIEGQEFPLELHFVHANSQSQLLVIAVLYQLGEPNRAIEALWESMPADQDAKAGMPIDPGNYLPADRSYYRVNGSLTTPPCSEGVRWHILKQTASVSAAQVDRLRAVLKQANNRPLQALNARVVIR